MISSRFASMINVVDPDGDFPEFVALMVQSRGTDAHEDFPERDQKRGITWARIAWKSTWSVTRVSSR